MVCVGLGNWRCVQGQCNRGIVNQEEGTRVVLESSLQAVLRVASEGLEVLGLQGVAPGRAGVRGNAIRGCKWSWARVVAL